MHAWTVPSNEPNDGWPLPGDPNVHVGVRHHLVPRFYLERFARNDRIAVVNRHTRVRRVSPIRDTAAEKDFYTYINVKGDHDGHLEQLLGHIEGDAASSIRNFTSIFAPDPTYEDHQAVCLFMAFQIARGRTARRRIELFVDLFGHLQGSLTQRQAPNASGEAGEAPEETRRESEARARVNQVEFIPDPNEHLDQIGRSAASMLPHLLSRPWFLFEFSNFSLLTSDEPVVLHTPGPHTETEAIGVQTAHEVWMPLDPKRLLILGRGGDPGPFNRLPGEPEFAIQSNRLVGQNAYDEIFLHPDFDIEVPELPPVGPLFRVTTDALPEVLGRYNKPPRNRRTQRRRPKGKN